MGTAKKIVDQQVGKFIVNSDKMGESSPIIKEKAPERVATPTIENYKHRARIIHLLQEKHTELLEKLNKLEQFDIEHDSENVTARLRDAKGLEFISSTPKTIRLVVESWKQDFKDAIAETERKLTEAFRM